MWSRDANMSVSMGSVSPRSHVESNNNNKSLVFVTVVGLICSILFTFVRYYYNHQDRRKWTEYFGLLALVSFHCLRLLILLI
jgi:hypothetical protein